jgi:Molecular chaperone (small heat shock protein)
MPFDPDDPFDRFLRDVDRAVREGPMGRRRGRTDRSGFHSETHLDATSDGECVRITGDLPGIEKADLQIRCDGEVVTISASGARRQYDERLALPEAVDEHSGSARFNNGVLEMSFDVREPAAEIDID